MPKKLLFIQPFQFVNKNLSNEPLMWFIYLGNYLRAKISHLDMDVIYLPLENNVETSFDRALTADEIKRFYSVLDNTISKLDFEIDNETVICISGISFDFLAAKLIAEYFQQNYEESIVIFGGYHASSVPSDFSYLNSPIDYVVSGEGEIALYTLLKDNIKKQKQPIIIEGSPINDLDDLPPLNLTLFDKYIEIISKKSRGLSISLSRGCPFKCSFCVESFLCKKNIKVWRSYRPERAVQEVNTLVNYGLSHDIQIYGFLDPCFGFKENWLKKFLDRYDVDERVKMHFVETRVDILNTDILRKLKIRRFFNFYGLESFSETMLDIMNKCGSSPTKYLEHFYKIFEIHNELGFNYTIGLILNHPGALRETYKENFSKLNELIQNDEVHVNLTLFHLFANTPNYLNSKDLLMNYGTKIYYPYWWKKMETLKLGAFAVKPSSELSLRVSIELFTQNSIEMNKIWYEQNKKERFGAFIYKKKILKTQTDELLKFLDDNNIEMEE